MVILSGLLPHAVLQRNSENVCTTLITGTTLTNTSITLVVKDACGDLITGAQLDSLVMKQEDNGFTFQATLTGIPVGGPYEIVFTQGDTLVFTDVFVGDLYVLAGQSNMEGIGLLRDKQLPLSSTRAFYMDGHWGIAEDPLHDLTSATDLIHQHINGAPFEARNPYVGTGPGVSFGHTLSQTFDVPVGLIPCAHGGTSMDQWSPDYEPHNGYGLYHMLVHRIYKAGGSVKGLFWYQGCSDTDAVSAATYYEKMLHFIRALRTQTHKTLPIVMVQIARMCSHDVDATYWNAIQNEQLKLSQTVNHLALVASIDLEMDDFIHISGASQNRLGVRCAKAMTHLIQGTGMPQPLLKSVHFETADGDWNATIVLTFENVIGTFSSSGRPYGFSLTHMDTGVDQNFIYRIECADHCIRLKTTESEIDLSQSLLHYGKGFMPYCNIVDGDDRALHAFSNIPLSSTPLSSLTLTKVWLSKSLDFNASTSTFKDFGYYFLNAHPWSYANGDAIIYHIPFESIEDQTLDLRIGGHGDFSVYLNDHLLESVVLNKPIHPNQYKCLCPVSMGRHVITVAYKPSSHSKGIFARFVSKGAPINLVLLDPLSL